MKLNLYPRTGHLMLLVIACSVINFTYAQNCRELTATYSTTESRCTATGSIQINASGGSGTYNYKVTGPTNIDYTSSSLIGGLQSGTYTVTVKDIVFGCTFQIANVVVAGTYQSPRFGLGETDVTCNNGNDGTISLNGLTNGRSPYVYTLVAPSPMGVGTTNSTGSFTGLTPGTYSVQMTDSCGAIQTRTISIQNYTWSMTSTSVTLTNCTSYSAQIKLKDSKGNVNTTGTAFNGFLYGVVLQPGDTTWFTSYSFAFDLGQSRSIALVAKDKCGNVQSASWTNSVVPAVTANVSLSAQNCTSYTATVKGQQNLTTPNYCLVDASGNSVPGQPCNPTGVFTNIPYGSGSYCILITNSCYDTVIKKCFNQTAPVPSIGSTATISNYTCTSVTITATGQKNLTSPNYCLYPATGSVAVTCNPNGVFNNVPYGAYVLKVTDGCTGTVLSVPVNAVKLPRSVAGSITTNGFTCSTFNATVTGATNLNNPKYCLVDSHGNPITCNNTGIFDSLAYGSYCVNVTDACNDTTIQRCVTVTQPPAPVGGVATISNQVCSGFTVTVTGQQNIFNGQYCLQDQNGNPVPNIPCNTTGVFTNVPYGSYCILTSDFCSKKVFKTCFSATQPKPSLTTSVSPITCAGYTVTIGGTNLFSATFCLYDLNNNQIGACNTTGVFNMTTFGHYYIKVTAGCNNTVFRTDFTINKPTSSLNANVTLSNQTCTTFSAAVSGQTNLANATYNLVNSAGTTISTNNSGTFNNIPNGSYCIAAVTACQDTTITRCFSYTVPPPTMTMTATPSCTYDSTDITINISSGFSPYTITVYDPSGNLLRTATSTSNKVVVKGLITLPNNQQYKVMVTGNCGAPATSFVSPNPSTLTHNYTIIPKCPSSIALTGSADLIVSATSNLGSVSMVITQQNFSPVTIGYSYSSGNTYTFSNLVSATYVITYSFTGCTSVVNDTITMPAYAFPSLGKSAAYQCDNNSFSVGASVTGGIGPFTYQIIASQPTTPSVSTAPQSNPVFNINNGQQYSLIRLRAVDACGNAALNDVSILPLANTIVSASSNCINTKTVLSTDSIPNATYLWYKKSSTGDSTVLGTGSTLALGTLTAADTGVYVNKMSVNNGCLTKLSYFDLTGICPIVLATDIRLSGTQLSASSNQLSWTDPSAGTGSTSRQFIVERSNEINGNFVAIGMITADASHINIPYTFTDNSPLRGTNIYRLAVQRTDNTVAYTNVVSLSNSFSNLVSIYPNPADKLLNISIQGDQDQDFLIVLYNAAGQNLITKRVTKIQNSNIVLSRPQGITAGIYLLKVSNLTTGESNVFKVIFK